MSGSPQLHGFDTESAYEDSVMTLLRPRLERLVARLAESGMALPAPDDLAEAMAAGVPDAATRSAYDQLLGPFYSSAGVMRLLGIPTKQALSDRRARGTVLAARTSDGVWVYPSFQFDPQTRSVRRGLVPVLAALKMAPRWGSALWLVTRHPELAGRAPLDLIDDASSRDLVRFLAEQYATAVAA